MKLLLVLGRVEVEGVNESKITIGVCSIIMKLFQKFLRVFLFGLDRAGLSGVGLKLSAKTPFADTVRSEILK